MGSSLEAWASELRRQRASPFDRTRQHPLPVFRRLLRWLLHGGGSVPDWSCLVAEHTVLPPWNTVRVPLVGGPRGTPPEWIGEEGRYGWHSALVTNPRGCAVHLRKCQVLVDEIDRRGLRYGVTLEDMSRYQLWRSCHWGRRVGPVPDDAPPEWQARFLSQTH